MIQKDHLSFSIIEWPFIALLLFLSSVQTWAQTKSHAFENTTHAEQPTSLKKNEHLYFSSVAKKGSKALISRYDVKNKQVTLFIKSSSPSAPLEEKEIETVKINSWKGNEKKGKVRQTFDNAWRSGKTTDDVVPLEYQYQESVSPNSSRFLIYRYDYSQPSLVVYAKILDSSLTLLQSVQIPIDNYATNHGLYINDKGELFIVDTNEGDGIFVRKLQPQIENTMVLNVEASSTRRHSLALSSATNDLIYIANVSENAEGRLLGVMYSLFNFATNRIDTVHFHRISPDLQKRLDGFSRDGRYHIRNFSVESNRTITIEIEKRSILGTEFVYDPYAVNDISTWKPRKTRVHIGERVIFKFNSSGKLLLEEVIDNFKSF